MTDALEPNVGRDLRLMHSLISRALRVSIDECRRGDDWGKRVGAAGEGFLAYVRTLGSVIEGHFALEDDVAVPLLAPRVPDAPLDELRQQHEQMRLLLIDLRRALDAIGKEDDMGAAKARLSRPLALLEGMWGPHIRLEEDSFSVERLAAAVPPEDHAALSAAFYEHSWKRVDPEYLALPFMLFNLSAAARTVFAARLPRIILEELVPGRWKDRWQPMKPFLLD